jgi:hypothetical protein
MGGLGAEDWKKAHRPSQSVVNRAMHPLRIEATGC